MTLDDLLAHLTRKLTVQRPAIDQALAYYTGSQPQRWIDPRVTDLLRGRVQPVNANFARLAVDVLAQRLRVVGFRSSPGEVVDRQLADLWQASNLDETSQLVQAEALTVGRSYLLVWSDSDGRVRISAESATQVAVLRDPMTLAITAALKRWTDAEGYVRSMLFTGDQVREYASRNPQPIDPGYTATTLASEPDLELVRVIDNPLGRVPMVALVNRPRLDAPDGESELTDLLPLIDAIGKTQSDMCVTSEYYAMPRRWATGVGDGSPMTDEQREQFDVVQRRYWEQAASSKFIVASNHEARFGAFPEAELTNYVAAIDLLTANLAALASLPPYYVSLNAANPTSADAIRSSESRLTRKAQQRMTWWSGAYEELMRLAVLVQTGQDDPRLSDLETLWADAEPATTAQTADAQAKLIGAGITDRRAALQALGMTPLEIDRILTTSPAIA